MWSKIQAHVAQQTLHDPFDPRSFPIYAIVLLKAMIALPVLIAMGFRFNGPTFLVFLVWLPIIAGGIMLRRLGYPRLGGAMEAYGALHGQGFISTMFMVMMAAISGPWADELLQAADNAIRFDWAGFIGIFKPWVRPLDFAYMSFMWQGPLVIFIMFWLRQEGRVWTFVTAATLSLLVATLIFPFFPAKGAFIHNGMTEFEGTQAAFSFLAPMEYLREGGRYYDNRFLTGMITFPSYHAAAGILFCWAVWRSLWRIPFLILNTGLMIGTILVGGHYLVDIIAGCLLAFAAIAASVRITGRMEKRIASRSAIPTG